jgi:hypothetical protein
VTVWCWVRDLSTGHRFDIPVSRLDQLEAAGAVEEIPGRRRTAHHPRKPKHFRRLDGRRAQYRPPRRLTTEE